MTLATETAKTVIIVGIRFRPAGRIYYFDPVGESYTTGQFVIVETVRGVETLRLPFAPALSCGRSAPAIRPSYRAVSGRAAKRSVVAHGLPILASFRSRWQKSKVSPSIPPKSLASVAA